MLKIALNCSLRMPDFYLRRRYTDVLLRLAAQCGVPVMPMILPLTDDAELIRAYAREFDGFIMTGGGDVHPSCYGEEMLPECHEPEEGRDEFELALLAEVTALEKPVFGICRGCQIMNVFCGGTLWQDFASQLSLEAPHCTKDENGSTHHPVHADGWLASAVGEERMMTNSYHHQSIKEAGRGLVICARSDDGIIEAFAHDSLPYYRAVQWHPEVDPDGISLKLYEEFLRSCGG